MNNQTILMYLRKSRSDDANESVEDTLARHEQILQEYAARIFGHRIPDKYIFREVVSGETIEARPMIKQVLHLMEDSGVKGVLVVEPQRLSRGDLIDCGTISNTFRYTNTICYTPTMTYHMDVKHERKFFEGELMRGGEYLEYVKEILQRGRILSVKNGNFIGSIPPYGYRKVQIGTKKSDMQYTLEIVPEEAEAVKVMYDVFVNQNKGFIMVCNELERLGYKPRNTEHWTAVTVKAIIENPVYIGKLRWNRYKTKNTVDNGVVKKSRLPNPDNDYIEVDGIHEPIISEELYYKALAKRGTNVRVPSRKKCCNPFAGLVYCGNCGKAMIYHKPANKTGARPVLYCTHRQHCHTRGCIYDDFEAYVIDTLKQCIKKFELELSAAKEHNTVALYESRLKQLQKELIEMDEQEDELYDLLETKIYTREIFLKRYDKLQKRKNEILDTIETLKSEKVEHVDYEQKIADFNAALTALTSNDFDALEKNALLKKCIKQIAYTRPQGSRWDNAPFSCKVTLQV